MSEDLAGDLFGGDLEDFTAAEHDDEFQLVDDNELRALTDVCDGVAGDDPTLVDLGDPGSADASDDDEQLFDTSVKVLSAQEDGETE